MSIDLQKPNHSDQLLKFSVSSYGALLKHTLPISALLILMGIAVICGPGMLPTAYQEHAELGAMFVVIAMLPVIGTLLTVIRHRLENQSYGIISLFIYACQRFISLIGAMVSMCLLPLIILFVSIGAYFALLSMKTHPFVLFIAPSVMYALLILSLIRKWFAVSLVFTEKCDANAAVETSEQMTRGFYWRTCLYVVFALCIFLLIFNIPQMSHYYVPASRAISAVWFEGTQGLLLFLVIPWAAALWIFHERDLWHRHQLQLEQVKQAKERKTKTKSETNAAKPKPSTVEISETIEDSASVAEKPKDDNVGF